MKKLLLLTSMLLFSCGSEQSVSKSKADSAELPFKVVETEEGLLIEEDESPMEAVFTASALLVARCAAHPACRIAVVEGGKTVLKFAASTAAGGMTWDWANKNLCDGSCYDLIMGDD